MNQLILKKITQNKRAYYEYFIEKKIEAGIVLLGWEVKSARSNMVTIDNSYVSFDNREAYIYNSIFQTSITQLYNEVYNAVRIRKLLLKKNELLFLMETVKRRGYTIVVLDLYWRYSWIKINIGIAKGKKKYDKRDVIDAHKWKKEKVHILKYMNK
ncbi:SsrA-binding protein SmpB [Candidatus Blochmannia vicinus]|uniref:SsrA-binding protein n=1 Tax=Candidatus Blochmannia vicinus (nom. nud.) TaxID=251540 RepID=A0A9Q8TWK6_9ENTR|nr:SsrA-binding protein SmpB [Candidatus Blochmannia vicinus]URJ28232.1 SsrA-binding protein SmpB [Candidatus Blochmannia vicinus]URJ33195.1 SsrA-binding protein SmpB [Candidatus Blochmannia vicinus]